MRRRKTVPLGNCPGPPSQIWQQHTPLQGSLLKSCGVCGRDGWWVFSSTCAGEGEGGGLEFTSTEGQGKVEGWKARKSSPLHIKCALEKVKRPFTEVSVTLKNSGGEASVQRSHQLDTVLLPRGGDRLLSTPSTQLLLYDINSSSALCRETSARWVRRLWDPCGQWAAAAGEGTAVHRLHCIFLPVVTTFLFPLAY